MGSLCFRVSVFFLSCAAFRLAFRIFRKTDALLFLKDAYLNSKFSAWGNEKIRKPFLIVATTAYLCLPDMGSFRRIIFVVRLKTSLFIKKNYPSYEEKSKLWG